MGDFELEPVIVPEKITMENVFLEKDRFENFSQENKNGLLNHHSKLFFHPTEKQLDDQCFNLCSVLAGFLLPRLIFFRDHSPGLITYPTQKEIEEDFEGVQKKNDDLINFIIEGFWLELNSCQIERTPEQEEKCKEARRLFAEYWGRFWF